MHGSCLSIPRTGGLKIKLFDEGENVWDFHRGRALDTKFKEETAKDMKALDRLGAMLRQSALRPGSRTNYNAWFRAWLAFCKQKGCRPLPAKQKPLLRFLTTLAMHYAVSSVKIAASAVVAVHRLNNKKNPFRNSMVLEDMLKGVEQCGLVGVQAQKCIVDPKFLARLVEQFSAEYPVFDRDIFDPAVEGESVIWLRSTVLTVLGLELGVRSSSLARLTMCCWQPRGDGTVGVQCDLAKNGKNGELFLPVLDYLEGSFKDNGTAISLMEEYWLPFIEHFGIEYKPESCVKKDHLTAHCTSCPKLFPVFGKDKVNKAIQARAVSDAVKRWAKRLGRDPTKYSAKSLRRGSTSIAAAMKVTKKIRQKHGGWKTKRMPFVYTEKSTEKEKAVSKAVHGAFKKSKNHNHKRLRFKV